MKYFKHKNQLQCVSEKNYTCRNSKGKRQGTALRVCEVLKNT